MSLEPSVISTEEPASPLIDPFCSKTISTLAAPSPIYTSVVPSPISISPTAFDNTKSSPDCSIFPASVPVEFSN